MFSFESDKFPKYKYLSSYIHLLTLIEFLPLFHLRKSSFSICFSKSQNNCKMQLQSMCAKSHHSWNSWFWLQSPFLGHNNSFKELLPHSRVSSWRFGGITTQQELFLRRSPWVLGLSQLLSRGSSASYGPASRKLSYRGTLGREQLGAMGVSCFQGNPPTVRGRCSRGEQRPRQPSGRTSCT